jgi:molybdopterin/thiamine biosynthesis adenylyltransferase
MKDYNAFYTRNIGIFSQEEQQKLKNACVFIAGVGGAGGIQASTLARMGIGELIIMDPHVFDEPDFNRQFGAMKSTLGKNKAISTGHLLNGIAPFTKVTVYNKVLDESELRKEISRCDLVVDAIDLSTFDFKAVFARIAREFNKYNLSCPIPDFTAILINFDPEGVTFEDYTELKTFPPMTDYAIDKYLNSKNYNQNGIPFFSSKSTNSATSALSGAFLASEVALILTGKREKKDIVVVPEVTSIDLLSRKVKTFNPEKELTSIIERNI